LSPVAKEGLDFIIRMDNPSHCEHLSRHNYDRGARILSILQLLVR
jgi:hypothetical protein